MEADTGDDVYGRYPIVCKRRVCIQINGRVKMEITWIPRRIRRGAGCPRRQPVLNDCSPAHPGTALTVEEATV